MKNFKKITGATSIVFIIAIAMLLIKSCAIHPQTWTPKEKPQFTGTFALNDVLKNASIVHLNSWHGPEDFAFDNDGNLYTGVHKGASEFSPGAILKISPRGKVEEYLKTEAWVTGLEFDAQGNLIALMNGVGLVQINQQKEMKVLVDKDANGNKILMGSGLKITSDGNIYFANISSEAKTTNKYLNKLFLELKPTGGVYVFDPKSKITTTLSKGNYFANGLEIAKDESYLLVSETSKYRILKYWLKGAKKGTSEVFLDNLPGFPNNISRRENGNYWIGFTTKRNDQLDAMHSKKGMKKFVYGLPAFVQPKAEKFGMILEVSATKKIIRALFDTDGSVIPEAGAIIEKNNILYIGGDRVSFVAKHKLKK